mgnify:CR=1 FL=1
MDSMEEKMQEAEMDAMKSLLVNILDVCFEKCARGNYTNNNLNKSESICTDECVTKVF